MKRIFCLTICIALMVTGMAGCSASQKEEKKTNQDNITSSTQNDDEEEAAIQEGENTDEDEDTWITEAKCTAEGTNGFVVRGNYVVFYAPGTDWADGEINIYSSKQGDRLLTVEGTISGAMISSNIVYFVMDSGLYSYSGGEDARLLTSEMEGFQEFLGTIDGKIYCKGVEERPDVSVTNVFTYDIESGEQNTYTLEDNMGHIDALITGNHLFYTGGHTDVSATALYELNVDTGESVKMDNYVNNVVADAAGCLYYMSYDNPDYTFSNLTLKCYDIDAEKTTDIFYDTAANTGNLVMADREVLFFSGTVDNLNYFKRWDFEDQELTTVVTDYNLSYLPDCESNRFYYAKYFKDDDGNVKESRVYVYNLDGEMEYIADWQYGQALAMANGYVYSCQMTEGTVGSYWDYGYGPTVLNGQHTSY